VSIFQLQKIRQVDDQMLAGNRRTKAWAARMRVFNDDDLRNKIAPEDYEEVDERAPQSSPLR